MIIDVNTYIGHYPFRKVKYHTVAELIALMDKYGIAKSCVSSLNAVYYSDCMQGNYELIKEISPFTDRLIPFCVINPEYNGAQNDLKKCVEKLGFKGLRLFPKQQGYKLDGEQSVTMLRMTAELNIPVHIPVILEDLRGRHPLDIAEQISPEEIKRAVMSAPDTNIILSNSNLQSYSRVIEPLYKGRVYYDIERLECLYVQSIGEVAKDAGYDHIVFGTGAMLQNIPVQLVKLRFMGETLGVTSEQIEGIKSGNLIKLIK